MTAKEMLEATNKITEYYEGLDGEIALEDISVLARDLLGASVHILSTKGHLLSCNNEHGDECQMNTPVVAKKVARSMATLTREQVSIERNGSCPFNQGTCNFKVRAHIMFPMFYASERIGTLVCTRDDENCDDLFLALCKMLAMLCAMAVYNEKKHRTEQSTRDILSVEQVKASLSYTEKEAIQALLQSLPSGEGLLNASTLSKEQGITRSVIASALKKLEGAGVMNVRSLGVKGTYITVTNKNLYRVFVNKK